MRARVKRAAGELNYVPNQTATRLAERQQSHNLAVLFGAPNAALLGEMISTGFTEAAASTLSQLFLPFVLKRPSDQR